MSQSEKRYLVYLILSMLAVTAVTVRQSPFHLAWGVQAAGQRGTVPPRAVAVDRTTPILERMTPAQRLHSQMFDNLFTTGKLLDEKLSSRLTRDRGIKEPKSVWDVVNDVRCASDDPFIGMVKASKSYPTADGTFLFTEYEVRVTDGLSNGEGALQPDTIVKVIRPGGAISVEGTIISATLSDSPSLVTGSSYLFFAKRIPETGAYRTVEYNSTFQVTDTAIVGLNPVATFDGDLSKGIRKDVFLNAVRAIGSCSQRR